MGIERFFSSLKRVGSMSKDGIILDIVDKINANYIYIDFNSIVYNIMNDVEHELNYLLYSIILHEHGSNILNDNKANTILGVWNCNESNLSNIDKFKTYFNNERIDVEIINRIKNYIFHISTKLVNTESVKQIFLALDGTPQMSKIVEQKKRKYNGYVISKLKEKIYESTQNDFTNERKLYEKYKFSQDNNKIASWSQFMGNVIELILSEEFKSIMKVHNTNLEEIIISDQNVFGEGEKKIMEHIVQHNKVGSYMLFSPDADIIILGIIAKNILNNDSLFQILRYNSQSNDYDCVNINMLCDNIYEYISKQCNSNDACKINVIDKIAITNDIAFIFTLFGNDFIPKIESIDVRNDIQTLISLYCNCTKGTKHLIFKDHVKFKINFDNFYQFICEIAKIENTLLYDTYMANKYKNYNFYKRELNVERLYQPLSKYVLFANGIFDIIRKTKYNSFLTNFEKQNELDKECDGFAKDIQFVKWFLILECKIKINDDDNDVIIDTFKKQLFLMQQQNDIIKGKMAFLPYDNNINDPYHEKHIRDNFIHDKMTISSYDIEIYKLEKRIGEYEKKLNATNIELGSISLTYAKNGNYKLCAYNSIEHIANYYETFFDIKSTKNLIGIKQTLIFDDNINKLVDSYIEGLMWVYDFYFNKNDKKTNTMFVSTWFYPYQRTPLLYQVRDVMSKYKYSKEQSFFVKMKSLLGFATTTNIVPNSKYMNKLEHYIYVTPKNKLILPPKYQSVIDSDKTFIDLNKIVDKLWYGNDGDNDNNIFDCSKIIDCRRIVYLNKCNLSEIVYKNFNEYMESMYLLR